ncbi:MAG: hypothetical protein AAGH81_09305 [Bacteroidota bacterium]
MNRDLGILFFGLVANYALGQTNNLTGSPYSLFGLGVSSNSNIGINNSIGNGGYAISGNSLINNLNPASYGNLGERNFLFDFGFLTEVSEIDNGASVENRIAGNFSNVALASSLGPKSAFGLSISPFSDTGYALIGIESNIEGSFDSFSSNIFGTGALNDLRFSYGRTITDTFRTGFYTSYLFGVIEERELVDASQEFANENSLTILERNFYRGLRFGAGFQYEVTPQFTLGWTVDLATTLSAKRDRTVQKNLDLVPLQVEEVNDEDIPSFRLPTEINTGIQYNPFKGLGITLDYSLKLWNETEQRDNVGVFVDEQDYSLGVQYVADPNSFRYHKRIKYRAGINYNTGYLEVNQNPVESYFITAGMGIPLGLRSLSHLNISYGFQNRGSTTGILIEENIHTFNINFSLRDIWFVKRKIN